MTFSLNYLKKLAKLSATIKKDSIVHALNNLGFEVEDAKPFVEGDKLVIGTIKTIKPHPNADRLQILQVNIGFKEIQIVTGATNVEVNKQVIVCLPGATCNNVTYKTVELRGVKSYGMLASLKELGIEEKNLADSSNKGVEILKGKYKNGSNALKALNLDDIILHIDFLSNRGDAHGYYFLATELSAYFDTEMKHNLFPELPSHFKSNITAKKGMANHLSLLEGESIPGESDFETQLLLMKSNIKPINKIVDLTNMALLLFGQPVHAYDKDKVGTSFNCELHSGTLETINNTKVKLKNNLVITSDDKPVSIAGVIGLNSTMVTDETKNVVFEIANFNPQYIRSTSTTLKIDNVTTVRNKKENALNVIPLTIRFLQNSLSRFSNTINEYKLKEKTILVEDEDINNYAGFKITKDSKFKEAIKFLKKLGYKIDNTEYTIPFYRYDIKNVFDVIEDIFRGYGYNNIPNIQPKLSASLISETNDIKKLVAIKNYNEIITYSLQDANYNKFNPFGFNRNIKIINPLSNKRLFYRFSLVKSMSDVAIQNMKYKIEKFSLFEVGFINGYSKNKHLGLISTMKTLHEIKTDIFSILSSYGNVEFRRTTYQYLHEGVTADIYLDDKYVGFVGKFRPTYLKSNFWIAEIILPPLNKKVYENTFINKDQLTIRDWTIVLNKKEDINKYINKMKDKLHIIYWDYLETYAKNDKQKAMTFRLYLDKKNAKWFDENYK